MVGPRKRDRKRHTRPRTFSYPPSCCTSFRMRLCAATPPMTRSTAKPAVLGPWVQILRARPDPVLGAAGPARRHGLIHHLGEVERPSPRTLLDLLATTEAIGEEQGLGRGVADRGQQDPLRRRHRNAVAFSAFEAEGAGHAA